MSSTQPWRRSPATPSRTRPVAGTVALGARGRSPVWTIRSGPWTTGSCQDHSGTGPLRSVTLEEPRRRSPARRHRRGSAVSSPPTAAAVTARSRDRTVEPHATSEQPSRWRQARTRIFAGAGVGHVSRPGPCRGTDVHGTTPPALHCEDDVTTLGPEGLRSDLRRQVAGREGPDDPTSPGSLLRSR